MKLEFAVVGMALVPRSEDAESYLRKNQDRCYLIELVKNRNPAYHRRAFKMMQIMHDMADIEIAFDPWRKWLLIQTGYFASTGFPDGSVLVEAKSMAYHKMSQEKFVTVWQDIHQKYCDLYGDKLTYNQLDEWSAM